MIIYPQTKVTKMSVKIKNLNVKKFTDLLPDCKNQVERFNFLKSADTKPRVAVFGKFNHGKSMLLNALIGQEEYFKTADKRETTQNKEFVDNNNQLIWVDTPGLDADVTGKDDQAANEGVFVSADIILLVHTLKAGELDRYEVEHIKRLLSSSKTTTKLLVLTQIDQVSAEQQEQAMKQIAKQFSQFEVFPVSAVRYLKGIEKNQPKMQELSGILPLVKRIQSLKGKVANERQSEMSNIKKTLLQQISDEMRKAEKEETRLENQYFAQLGKVTSAVEKMFN